MANWILFHVLDHNKITDYPKNQRKVIDGVDEDGDQLYHLETDDEEWVIKHIRLGAIERLDRTNLPGIKKVIIVERAVKSDPVEYRLQVSNGDLFGVIMLSESEIFSYKKYREKHFAKFQQLPPKLKTDEWEAVIVPLVNEAERVREDTNEAPIVLEVINKIENSEVVAVKEALTAGAGNRVWLDTASDTLYMLGKDLEPIAEKYKIELRRLSELLDYYKKGNTEQERIGTRRFQLWPFKPSLFKLKKNETGGVQND